MLYAPFARSRIIFLNTHLAAVKQAHKQICKQDNFRSFGRIRIVNLSVARSILECSNCTRKKLHQSNPFSSIQIRIGQLTSLPKCFPHKLYTDK